MELLVVIWLSQEVADETSSRCSFSEHRGIVNSTPCTDRACLSPDVVGASRATLPAVLVTNTIVVE